MLTGAKLKRIKGTRRWANTVLRVADTYTREGSAKVLRISLPTLYRWLRQLKAAGWVSRCLS